MTKLDIEEAIKRESNQISKKFGELGGRIRRLLEQKKSLINCLRSVKSELIKGDVQLYRVTRAIDSTLLKIEKGE